jgi:hypothetical protein
MLACQPACRKLTQIHTHHTHHRSLLTLLYSSMSDILHRNSAAEAAGHPPHHVNTIDTQRTKQQVHPRINTQHRNAGNQPLALSPKICSRTVLVTVFFSGLTCLVAPLPHEQAFPARASASAVLRVVVVEFATVFAHCAVRQSLLTPTARRRSHKHCHHHHHFVEFETTLFSACEGDAPQPPAHPAHTRRTVQPIMDPCPPSCPLHPLQRHVRLSVVAHAQCDGLYGCTTVVECGCVQGVHCCMACARACHPVHVSPMRITHYVASPTASAIGETLSSSFNDRNPPLVPLKRRGWHSHHLFIHVLRAITQAQKILRSCHLANECWGCGRSHTSFFLHAVLTQAHTRAPNSICRSLTGSRSVFDERTAR